MRSTLATGLLALALLLRALLPAAQALPAPADTSAGAPDGPTIIICSALGGSRIVTPEGEPLPTSAKPPSDCLVCQGLALGYAALQQSERSFGPTDFVRRPEFHASGRPLRSLSPTGLAARAPPAFLAPS